MKSHKGVSNLDWVTGIQNAINYVEEHLTDEIDYDLVSKEAACSNFYFQRIFSILCGITLGDYIRSRRLTLAGNELCATDTKVIDIALKYGYESPESFTRAFTKFHGVTPSEAKKDGSKLKSFSRLSVKITLSGGNIMDYKIIEKDAFDIIEKVETHTVDNSENAKSIPDFWTRSHKDGTVKMLTELTIDRTFIFGVCYENHSEDAKTFDYSIAANCDSNTAIPEGFKKTLFLQERGLCLNVRVLCRMQCRICGTKLFQNSSRHQVMSLPMKWILKLIPKEI